MKAIEVESLSYIYPDGTPALNKTTFQIEEGERVGIIGANGAGKTTLLHHLNGLLPSTLATTSPVRIFGSPVNYSTVHHIRSQVGLLFQDPDDQLFCPTVGEDVAFGPKQFGLSKAELDSVIKSALIQVGLQGFEQRAPHRLSRGEKRRVCLAGVLACNVKILALDEPTSDLDPRSRRDLITILKVLPITQIIASHDLDFITQTCQRVIIMYKGNIATDGETALILSNEELLLKYGL